MSIDSTSDCTAGRKEGSAGRREGSRRGSGDQAGLDLAEPSLESGELLMVVLSTEFCVDCVVASGLCCIVVLCRDMPFPVGHDRSVSIAPATGRWPVAGRLGLSRFQDTYSTQNHFSELIYASPNSSTTVYSLSVLLCRYFILRCLFVCPPSMYPMDFRLSLNTSIYWL